MKFYLVATDIESGEPYYYDVKDINDESLDFVRASASMPIFASPVHINGAYFILMVVFLIPFQSRSSRDGL